jgi:hypothetical protein
MARPELATEMPDTLSLPVEVPRIYTGKTMLTSDTVQAVLLVLCAAIMNAAYALPMILGVSFLVVAIAILSYAGRA